MKISIIIVTFNRTELLLNCLDSFINESLNDKNLYEVIVVLNGDHFKTRQELKERFPQIKILESKKVTPGEARNKAIKVAQGQFLCFLDDDVELPSHYFKTAKDIYSTDKNIDIFGGHDQISPRALPLEKIIGITLTSPMATAHTRFRHQQNKKIKSPYNTSEAHLILCNMWIKKSLFEECHLYFDQRFYRNEENVLLYQFRNKNKVIKFIPNLFVFHRKKKSFHELAYVVRSSGIHRMRTIFFYPKSSSVLHLIPLFFVIYLCLLPISLTLDSFLIYFLPLLLYILLIFINSIYLSIIHKEKRIDLFAICFFIVNINYGFGFLQEIYTQLRKKFRRPA